MTVEKTRERFFIFLAAAIFGSIFIFFAFFFRNHLYFQEQLQVFIPDLSHFAGYYLKPAALSSWSGDFLTQFYYLKGGGAVVITACLIVLWLLTGQFCKRIFNISQFHPLLLLPVISGWIALCDPEYPVSNIISIIIAVSGIWFCASLENKLTRLAAAIVLVPLIYGAAGSAVMLFSAVLILFELLQFSDSRRFISITIIFIVTLVVPFILREKYLLTLPQAYGYLSVFDVKLRFWHYLPLLVTFLILLINYISKYILIYILKYILKAKINSAIASITFAIFLFFMLIPGIRHSVSFDREKILSLDLESRNNNWQRVLELSSKYRMHSSLASYYSNMAMAKLGMIGDSLMNFYQPAATGLFIPVNADADYFTITLSNEVYWQLGDVNACQHSALLGMIFSPRSQNSRLLKRMIEINIVNRQYAVAEKYISILEKTMFHRKWATGRRKYLYNEKECGSAGWIREKREIIPVNDYLKKSDEYLTTLRMLAEEHPGNQMAVDYLLCFHLLSKDISGFANDFKKYYTPSGSLPLAYQEALLVRIASGAESREAYSQYRFNPSLIKNLADYMKLYEEGKGNGLLLKDKYEKTYWFYYHFATLIE